MQLTKVMDELIIHFKSNIHKKGGKLIVGIQENDQYEFKQSLQLSGESVNKSYLKAIGGFANNRGGAICFGIDPNTNELTGINDKFENLDNRHFTTGIVDGLDGVIQYEFFTIRIENILLGFLIVKEAASKPVILKTNFDYAGDKGVAGDIYYRYPGRTSRITFGDLRMIINKEVQNISRAFMNRMEYILTNGPENFSFLDIRNGELSTGVNNSKFVLSRETLQQLNLIKEGEIIPKDGAPAYTIKGTIEAEETKFIEKQVTKALHASEIFRSFFTATCDAPLVFLKEILFQDSPYYPIFIYIRKANLTNDEAIELLKSVNDTDIKPSQRSKLIDRINLETSFEKQGSIIATLSPKEITLDTKLDTLIDNIKSKHSVPSAKAGVRIARSIAYVCLKHQLELPKGLQKKYLKNIFEACTHLTDKEVIQNKNYLLPTLHGFYPQMAKDGTTDAKTVFRKVAARFDKVLYSK